MRACSIGLEYIVLNMTDKNSVTEEAVEMISMAMIQDARMNLINHFVDFDYEYDDEEEI